MTELFSLARFPTLVPSNLRSATIHVCHFLCFDLNTCGMALSTSLGHIASVGIHDPHLLMWLHADKIVIPEIPFVHFTCCTVGHALIFRLIYCRAPRVAAGVRYGENTGTE